MFTGSISDPLYDLIHSADHCWWSEDEVEGVEEGCSLLVVDVLSVCISGYHSVSQSDLTWPGLAG